jgi:hypothetical protein
MKMKAEMTGKIQYGVWGLVGGAVVAMVIGFSWGGWSTAGATQKITEDAVLTSQTAICVAQYMQEPNSNERLKELEKIESYKRSEFIEKGGWDKMPGQKDASFGVARACAEKIEGLIKK